jgi:prepilin-type N-terminal cleavage/methylation domain-containing protein
MLNRIDKNRGGFTLVEIMIVVAIIALLAAIAVPGFLRARKRSQATRILNDLRLVDGAVDQYAIENAKSSGDLVQFTDWKAYLKKDTALYNTGNDMLGNSFGDQHVDTLPGVPHNSFEALSDVAPATFWSPYSELP